MTISSMFLICSLNCVLGGVIVVLSAIIISHNRRLRIMERGRLEPVRTRSAAFFSSPVVAATMTPADAKPLGDTPPESCATSSAAGSVKPVSAPVFVAPKVQNTVPRTPSSSAPPAAPAAAAAIFQGVLKSQEKKQLSLKQEINQMLACGMDLSQIADHLGISQGTVRLAAAVRNAETSAHHGATPAQENRKDPARNPRNWPDVSDMKSAWCVGTAQ